MCIKCDVIGNVRDSGCRFEKEHTCVSAKSLARKDDLCSSCFFGPTLL